MTTETDALLPCPFCGGRALLHNAFPAHAYPWHVSIEHGEECPDRLWDGLCYITEAKAIAAWNTRPDAQRVAKLEAALRECRKAISGGRSDPRRNVREIVDAALSGKPREHGPKDYAAIQAGIDKITGAA